MSSNKSAATQSRSLRTISILLLVIVGFSGLAIVQGATSFKLGLDLQGGTSVTLQPRIGAGGCLVNFMHPKSTGGVLIELSQRPE